MAQFKFEQNVGGKPVILDVAFEDDALGILVSDDETGEELLDIITKDQNEIHALLIEVTQAVDKAREQ